MLRKIKSKIYGGIFILGVFLLFKPKVTFAGEMHVCPGSGESCVAEIKWGGEIIKVNSFKTKGSGSIVVK
jgi:hypothetical protein